MKNLSLKKPSSANKLNDIKKTLKVKRKVQGKLYESEKLTLKKVTPL